MPLFLVCIFGLAQSTSASAALNLKNGIQGLFTATLVLP
jgi:hypothetical protein